MMSDKMVRFLTSIKINNIDDFDLDFEMVGYNRFDKKQLDMVIVKKTPWQYELLREFQDGLETISYKYLLRFSYLVRPNFNDVSHLFEDWYQTLYRLPPNLNMYGEGDDKIYIEYADEAEKEQYLNAIIDFRSFLEFLCYDFVIIETIKPKEEEQVVISERKLKKIIKEADKEAEEAISNDNNEEEVLDSSNVAEQLEKEREEINKNVGDTFLEMARQNLQQMIEDRKRARLNKRGNYQPIDNIDSITAQSGNVDFNGKIFSIEIKEFGGRKRLTVGIGDAQGGAIYLNMYENNQVNDDVIKHLVRNTNVRIRGVAYLDDFNKSLQIRGHYIDILPPDEVAPEPSEEHRVELHLHSRMSAMDGVGSMDEYCEYAKALGHTAIAITDHGVVQGYPDAQAAAKKTGIKMLYGCELYMVEDKLNAIKNPCNVPLNKAKYVVFDLETTGLSCRYDKIIEFGAVKIENGFETGRLDILINPQRKIPQKIVNLTKIHDDMVKNQPTIDEAFDKILEFIGDAILVAHNAAFDYPFLQEELKRCGRKPLPNSVVDTLPLSRYLFPNSRAHNLGALCRNLEINYDPDVAHRADYDASVLNEVWQPMISLLNKIKPGMTHADLGDLQATAENYKHFRPLHVTAFAKDKEGLKDLYKLVSIAHTQYWAEVPRIPRNEIEKLRSHLLIGSACMNGEVFEAARNSNEDRLKQLIKFYDYIEVQPLANYSWLIGMDELSEEEIIRCVKDIVNAADEVGVPVCATGDCHYVKKEDKKFRDVFISAKGIGGVPHPLNPYARSRVPRFENPDQYFLTTQEMLDAMSFLGEEKAYEITVTNTNKIADSIETLKPLPNDKLYTPTIENCEQMLTDMVYAKAKSIYGDPLPEVIQKRLETELNGIISNGYSVIYYIAHKLIKKTNDDGYIVGSRGSVGSSLVATMANITEVNPLAPHYICKHCHHLEWVNETDPDVRSGFDLPDKKCPICGEEMIHDGQNIPFQTFLGFNAEKVPDIDLNFPPDYQARAHAETKVLLGEGNVFRAGTISGVEEKTAFGFARGYIERLGLNPDEYPRAKIAYLASGCVGTKRTTGQHPGGIVVVPQEYEVYDFTPVQYPADDMDAAWKTTHFDFHSIHDTILKLDLLGHVDPQAMKMMADLTGVDISTIPMNDPKVLSLFSSNKALGMKHDYLQNRTGAMGIPEFGTENSRRILEETMPTKFSDLVIISGLSHGTNVWSGNAEKLIQSGVATLREVIGCRDDIMTYLISMGLPPNISFAIMEDVRKGRGLKPEYVEIMKAHNVKQYYIDSCNLIKYMFPKGHAVAYVTMAVRVGYFKIYYPLEFYATFFTVRCDQYDIQAMVKGEQAIISRLDELKLKSRNKTEKLSPKETELIKTLSMALEMVQRGYKFENINLDKSDSSAFVVNKENKSLIPPFKTLDGLGENNAKTVVEARKDGPFHSKEELLRRTKLTSTNVEDLAKLGVLDGLDESDQLSLFDGFDW